MTALNLLARINTRVFGCITRMSHMYHTHVHTCTQWYANAYTACNSVHIYLITMQICIFNYLIV